jgi:hypothetical protein
MDNSIFIALISVFGVLVGSIVGAVVTYYVQKRLLDAQTNRNIHSNLLEKRITALQQLNLALDFIFGNIGKTEGGPVGELFRKIIHEMPMHLIFLPAEIREEARDLMFKYFAGARDGTMNLDHDSITGLRKKVLKLIDESYELYSNIN